ncbi:hypothetical protein [Nereida sp. MMG025]|uniref:hypothetical protein n=1 Tax=Nereida sp. MMG025 TaxID=2909981 RepID=UPI001F3FE68B|nr:hypothetical protein [Nereida sp. MMG025]MCF6444058.1 hypothetical protein [Nereida sp. MMG025]
MEKLANTFWKDHHAKGNGAIDWIVLTAGATFLSFGIAASLFSNYNQEMATDELPADGPALVQTL